MKTFRSSLPLIFFTFLFLSGCKPKDSDIQSSVEKNLRSSSITNPASVSVDNGVVTLTGQLETEDARTESERIAKDVKGVKSVVNNITITPPAAPITQQAPVIASDDVLNNGVRDAVKDFPTVTTSINDGVITLTGNIQRSQLPTLIQSLNALRPKKINNQLTIK